MRKGFQYIKKSPRATVVAKGPCAARSGFAATASVKAFGALEVGETIVPAHEPFEISRIECAGEREVHRLTRGPARPMDVARLVQELICRCVDLDVADSADLAPMHVAQHARRPLATGVDFDPKRAGNELLGREWGGRNGGWDVCANGRECTIRHVKNLICWGAYDISRK